MQRSRLRAMAGPDRRDATAAKVPVPDYVESLGRDVRGMRIGLSPDYAKLKYPDPETGELIEQEIAAEVLAAVEHAAQVYAGLGAEIVDDVPMPNTRFGIPAYFVISRVEAASNLHRYDGVKYGYRTPDEVQDLPEMYRRSRRTRFWPAA